VAKKAWGRALKGIKASMLGSLLNRVGKKSLRVFGRLGVVLPGFIDCKEYLPIASPGAWLRRGTGACSGAVRGLL
jgi:hypothetical protein